MEAALIDQHEYDVRFDWGLAGLRDLGASAQVLVIVDVLSFSTCVDVATARGAFVYPFGWKDERSALFAESVGGIVAASRRTGGRFTLSPASLTEIPTGTRLVLPSPNGSTLSVASRGTTTFAGCLRNAAAVAKAATRAGGPVAIIGAGERRADGSIRFALEDLLGAGAIVHHLPGTRSPDASAAEAAFFAAQDDLLGALTGCASGRELAAMGFPRDIEIAAELNVSRAAPRLSGGFYSAQT